MKFGGRTNRMDCEIVNYGFKVNYHHSFLLVQYQHDVMKQNIVLPALTTAKLNTAHF